MVSERGDDDRYVLYEVDQQKAQLNFELAMKLERPSSWSGSTC